MGKAHWSLSSGWLLSDLSKPIPIKDEPDHVEGGVLPAVFPQKGIEGRKNSCLSSVASLVESIDAFSTEDIVHVAAKAFWTSGLRC